MAREVLAHAGTRGPSVTTALGAYVGVSGVAFALVGLWARREVRCALAQERIVMPAEAGSAAASITTGAAARSMAERIRKNTLEATAGRTYSEVPAYLDEEGRPTSDIERAIRDERTGEPLEHPDHDLWIQSTTLQTALTQAFMASQLAAFSIALGTTFVAVGLGLAATGRRAG